MVQSRKGAAMDTRVKLPIGIENFEKIRTNGFYYVDKTGLIKDLLDNCSEVNLFTRPRRFGKSLNMNMLKYFFEYGCDPKLFEGLAIYGEKQLCKKHMGKYPVISVTLKDVNGNDYRTALGMLRTTIGKEAMRFQFLLESDKLTAQEKISYEKLIAIDTANDQFFSMSQEVLASSLLTLCEVLHRHYGQKAILLIDEYDVPLDKAQYFGYYDEMISLIRNLFSQALKSNHSLAFAVLTGCLRVSRESIFTGLNNLNVLSITNIQSDERFGFTDSEVRAMAEYYSYGDKFDQIKEWFQKEARRDTPTLDAFAMGDVEAAEKQFNAYLARTISIRDTSVRKSKKENFYHGILLGLLSHREEWYIRSNVESGNGYSDILVEIEEEGIGIVIEVKYPDSGKKPQNSSGASPEDFSPYEALEKSCKEALQQIETKGYEKRLRQDGLETILKYGVACNRKKCRILRGG